MTQRVHDIRVGGGRTLRVHEGGAPGGVPVVVHHGTPDDGSLFDPWLDDARERGIRLLGYDRPGYGGSTPVRGRSVAAAAADVAAIADALEIERFATWGVSGGGPHALACAALLPERVVGAASLAGVAPFDADGLNYFAGMGEENIVEIGAALMGRETLEPRSRADAQDMLNASPGDFIGLMQTLVSPPDAAVLSAELGEFWAASMPAVFAQGVEGWIDDNLAVLAPFGFDARDIDVPVLVWHGRQDRFVPPAHGQWLANTIPNPDVRFTADDGHLTLMVNRIPEVHAWLIGRF